MLGERGANLSGGQKQRISLARAAYAKAPLVVLDDVVLDKESGRTVVEMLKALGRERGATTVMVTHDNRILELADRVVTLEDGRIVKDVAGSGIQTLAVPAMPG